MKILPAIPSGCDAMPIARGYLAKAAYLFTGSTLRIALNDTPFSDEAVIQEHIEAGITLADGINFLVEKYELVCIDRRAFGWLGASPYLRAVDILRGRRDKGLLRLCRGSFGWR